MSYSVMKTGSQQKPLLTVWPNKALKVSVETKADEEMLAILSHLWPMQPTMTEEGFLRLPAKWSSDNTALFILSSLPTSLLITKSGWLLWDEMHLWLDGEESREEVLRGIAGVSGWDELYSSGCGASWCVFKVGPEWREIGFVEDPDTAYLCLYESSTGDREVIEWTAVDYDLETAILKDLEDLNE